MRNLFFAIYGGIFLSVLIVISTTYLAVQKINNYRYQSYLENITKLTAELIVNGVNRQEVTNKTRWLELVSSLIDAEHKIEKNPDLFQPHGVVFDSGNRYKLVLPPTSTPQIQITLSINDFSDTWLSATAFLTLNELGHYAIEQRPARFEQLQQISTFSINRTAREQLALTTKQLRNIDLGNVVFERNIYLGHQEWIKAYSSWGSTQDVLELGKVSYFEAYPIKILLPALVITLVLIAGIVWLLLEHLRLKVIQIHQTVDAIGSSQNIAQPEVDGKDSIAALKDKIHSMGQRIDKLLGEQAYMIRAISHDLRTPIARLRFRLESISISLLEYQNDDEIVSQCQDDIGHLDLLIDELLTYEHLSTKPDTRHTLLAVNTILQRETEEVSLCYPNTEFTFHNKTQATVTVLGNEILLQRLFSNVLTNAGKYANYKVEVNLEVNDNRVLIHFSDDGQGFDPESLTELFKPFYKGNSARTVTDGGFGLGLAICKQITQQHKGKINADNNPNGGASITISLPVGD